MACIHPSHIILSICLHLCSFLCRLTLNAYFLLQVVWLIEKEQEPKEIKTDQIGLEIESLIIKSVVELHHLYLSAAWPILSLTYNLSEPNHMSYSTDLDWMIWSCVPLITKKTTPLYFVIMNLLCNQSMPSKITKIPNFWYHWWGHPLFICWTG